MPSATIIAPPVGHISEFSGGYTGTCGPTALSVAICASKGIVVTEQYMVELTKEMVAKGWTTNKNGATTIGQLQLEATFRGVPTEHSAPYSEPFPFDWVTYLRANAGKVPIIIELANGQALHDAETGSGENATNLHYHYICVVGKQDDGYIVADGDNFQVLSRFQIYDLGTLTNAKPCSLLSLKMTRSGGTPMSNVPKGWTDDGKTLRNPANSFVVTAGFRDEVLKGGWNPNDVPQNNAFGATVDGKAGTEQDFRDEALMWDATQGVWHHPYGPDVISLRSQLDAANQSITDLTNSLKTDMALIGTLQAKVSQLEASVGANDTAMKALAAALTNYMTPPVVKVPAK